MAKKQQTQQTEKINPKLFTAFDYITSLQLTHNEKQQLLTKHKSNNELRTINEWKTIIN